MRKISVIAAVALLVVAACSQGASENWMETLDNLHAYVQELEADESLSEEQFDSLYFSRYEEVYRDHLEDSAGLITFKTLVTNWWEPEVALQEYEAASELIKSNELIAAKIEALKNIDATQPGCQYIDIKGTDILTGEELSISSVLAKGKPVIVDFWASWCPPCKREIKNNLIPLAETGKYSIIGIAVWEDAQEDTEKMMETLGVSWPVMYTGGRVGSPSIQYGVVGIPTMILISTDGAILGRGHSLEEIL